MLLALILLKPQEIKSLLTGLNARDALAKNMVEVTHLPGAPWDKTMKEKGPGKQIDYLLAIDGSKGALSLEEIKERLGEVIEVVKIFDTPPVAMPVRTFTR